jgi:hypothetical protein
MLVTGCTEPASTAGFAGLSEDDRRFLAAFESCELPESEWTHLAHIRVAWVCFSLASPAKALQRIREGILRYNTIVLKRRHRYHETVTIAFARIVAARRIAEETWQEFSLRIDDIVDPENPVLLQYYSGKRLFSAAARQDFVEPDRRELPGFCEKM